MTQNSISIKLVDLNDNPSSRGQHFFNLLTSYSDDMKEVYYNPADYGPELDEDRSFHVFFNSGVSNDLGDVVASILDIEDYSYSFWDLTEDYIDQIINKDDDEAVSHLVIGVTMANHVSCDTASAQEKLYDLSGRLCTVIRNPLKEGDLKDPNFGNNNYTLWYGKLEDLFTIKKMVNRNDDLVVAIPSSTSLAKDSSKFVVYKSMEKRNEIIENARDVYLPPTYTVENELERLDKVEECVRLGKLVYAPDLDMDWENLSCFRDEEERKDFFNVDYDDVNEAIKSLIRDRQNIIRQKHDPYKVFENLVGAMLFAYATEEEEHLAVMDLSLE